MAEQLTPEQVAATSADRQMAYRLYKDERDQVARELAQARAEGDRAEVSRLTDKLAAAQRAVDSAGQMLVRPIPWYPR
jgi:hypothetical protein